MTRYDYRTLLTTTFLTSSLGVAFLPEATARERYAAKERYNVLFIICDDLNCDMACYDDPIVQTPNLDRLRAGSVRFTDAYCQYPFSGPSRASFLTGWAPDHVKVKDLETNFRDLHPKAVTMPGLFKQNGYFTGRVGKIFHAGVPNDIGTPGMDDPQSWTETFNPIGYDKTHEKGITNLTPHRHLGSSLSYMMVDGPDSLHTDAKGAEAACRMISEHRDDPFFIAMGFYRPHSPYVAPTRDFERYPLEKITMPERPDDDWDDKPLYGRFTQKLNWGLSLEDQKKAKRAYYATITFMDRQVGKILATLDREGLTGKTVIVFCSDHGYNLGEHGQWMKQALFEKSTRVPMMISVPGRRFEKGKDCRSIVELLDLYPTLASLCGLEGIPEDLDGDDITPLLRDASKQTGDDAISVLSRRYQGQKYMKKGETVEGRSIRMDRYRLTEWNDGEKGGELYDYEQDPEEFHNLWNDPDHRALRDRLSKRLHERIEKLESK